MKWLAILSVLLLSLIAMVWVAYQPSLTKAELSFRSEEVEGGITSQLLEPVRAVATVKATDISALELETSGVDRTASTEELDGASLTLTFFGRAVTESGLPIQGAQVVTSRGVETSTDDRGTFELNYALGNKANASLSASGRVEQTFNIEAGHGTVDTAREFTLRLAASLRVLVLGAPRDELTVRCMTKPKWVQVSSNNEWSPIEHEEYEKGETSVQLDISNLPAQQAILVKLIRSTTKGLRSHVTLRTAEITLEPGEVRRLEFDLNEGATIHGLLVEEYGSAVPNHEIWITSVKYPFGGLLWEGIFPFKSVITDASGHFDFAGIAPGRWWVGPSPKRQLWHLPDEELVAPVATLVKVEVETKSYEVTLIAHRELYIRGRLLDPFGNPLGDKQIVHAYNYEDSFRLWTDIFEGGAFKLGPLIPGSYELYAPGRRSFNGAKPITVEAGANDVILRYRRGIVLKGEVIDATTGQKCRADIRHSRPSASRDTGPSWFQGQGPSANYGDFEVSGLGPGRHFLCAKSPDGRVGMASVVLEENDEIRDVVIILKEGSTLRIRNKIQCDFAFVNVWLGDTHVGWGMLDHWEQDSIAVPPGSLRVILSATGVDFERTVILSRGETKLVVFAEE